MKVTLNGLKQFADISLSIDELVEKIGAQLGAVEEVVSLGERYKDALIVKVVKCDKHTDADKLSVCFVDDGKKFTDVERNDEGFIQIVCGAPNVTEGMLAVWLPPGSVVPSTLEKDPFTLEAREIRGVKSNGMLASAKELGIGDSHEGLLVVDKEAQPGDSFAELYKLDDYVIDIENKMFTHRPDLFGTLGIAREVAGISGQAFASPRWYSQLDNEAFASQSDELVEFKTENHAPTQVPRLMSLAMSSVSVAPSPIWLQVYLSKLGLRPINNIVDMTNFIMHTTAQPVHAYDFDKVKALSGDKATLAARLSHQGEKLKLLSGKEITLDDDVVVMATDKQAIGLGGIMGGAETEVDNGTKNIIIECANFDMNLTRKTAMRYGLFTDAVTRFTKGQSAMQNPYVLQQAATMAQELSGAVVSGAPWDVKSNDFSGHQEVNVSADLINSRLGTSIAAGDMKHLLENVEFSVEASGQELKITVPFWRTDIEIPEDIVEEIGRLYGYNNLPDILPSKTITPSTEDKLLAFKSRIRNLMAAAGANEVLTYSFVHGSLLQSVGQKPGESFHIKNALSPALQYYRQSLMPSLLSTVHPNVKNGYDKFAVFELGKGHIKKGDTKDEPNEMNMFAFAFVNDKKGGEGAGAAYFQAKNYLENLCSANLKTQLIYEPIKAELDFAIAKPYEPSRSALVKLASGEMLGIIGEFRAGVINSLKLPIASAGFEIDLDALLQAKPGGRYYPLNKYPELSQDITLRVDANIPHADLENALAEALSGLSEENGIRYLLRPLSVFQRDEDTDYKQMSWHVTLFHPERTLNTQEVNKVFDMLGVATKDKFKAERV